MKKIYLNGGNIFKKVNDIDYFILENNDIENFGFFNSLIALKLEKYLELSIPGLWGMLEIPEIIVNKCGGFVEIWNNETDLYKEGIISKTNSVAKNISELKNEETIERYISFRNVNFTNIDDEIFNKNNPFTIKLTVFLKEKEDVILYYPYHESDSDNKTNKYIFSTAVNTVEKRQRDRLIFNFIINSVDKKHIMNDSINLNEMNSEIIHIMIYKKDKINLIKEHLISEQI
ncbi:MAG: hypothetical protein JXR51_12440 [Bacteroidales bacterium]|nr:hypothetical protein [Bacteroidales bacterium]MBN2757977.1 hypothetical protein [Bacteroidales bacterium]